MTIVAVLEAVALVATVCLFLRHIRGSEAAWTVERGELLNRIQRPEYTPTPNVEPLVLPDPEPDHSELVGSVAPAADDYVSWDTP